MELETEHTALLEAHAATDEALQEQRAHCQQLRNDLEQAQRVRTPPAADPRAGNNSRVSWQADADAHRRDPRDVSHTVDGSRFEESVGGGMATSTPAFYGLHPPETAQQALHEKNTLIGLYKVRQSASCRKPAINNGDDFLMLWYTVHRIDWRDTKRRSSSSRAAFKRDRQWSRT